MAELTRDSSFKPVSPVHSHSYVDVEDDANEIYAAAFVQRTATGRAVIVGDTGGLGVGPVIGVNERNIPDQAGKTYSGPLERPTAKIYVGQFERPIAAASPVTDADMWHAVYAANNHDVCSDPSKPLLGIMVGINNDAGTCTVLVSASIGAALGAAKLGSMPLPLASFYEADGTPLAAFADGASTTPGLSLNDSECAGIRWNNDAAPDPIVTSAPLPRDLDTTKASYLIFTAAKVNPGGTTPADVPNLGVEVFEHPIGALYDAGADLGGNTNAMADEPTKEAQALVLAIAADSFSDPSAATNTITITVTPEAGKLGTDDLVLISARLAYTPRI